jgi:hypothetical protein
VFRKINFILKYYELKLCSDPENKQQLDEAVRMSGFIAQEVERDAQQSGYDFDGVIKPQHEKDHYRLAYGEFVVPLVKAVQEQQAIIENPQKQIDDTQQQIDELKTRLDKMEKLLMGK